MVLRYWELLKQVLGNFDFWIMSRRRRKENEKPKTTKTTIVITPNQKSHHNTHTLSNYPPPPPPSPSHIQPCIAPKQHLPQITQQHSTYNTPPHTFPHSPPHSIYSTTMTACTSNPLAFNALINGIILTILGIAYARMIYPYDFSFQDEAHFCEGKLYPIPIALLLCGLAWLGYFIKRRNDNNNDCVVIGEDDKNEPNVPFIIMGCAIALFLMAIFAWGAVFDHCGGLTELSALSMCVFVPLGLGWFSSSLFYIITRDRLGCLSTKSARWWMGLYPLAPFTMWWFCLLCCSTRNNNKNDHHRNQVQLDQFGNNNNNNNSPSSPQNQHQQPVPNATISPEYTAADTSAYGLNGYTINNSNNNNDTHSSELIIK